MVHEKNNEHNQIHEEGENNVDARKLEENEIVDGAKIETRKLAASIEESDSGNTSHVLAFLDGPDSSGLHKEKNTTDSAFGRPLNTAGYSHLGQKMLTRYADVGMLDGRTLPVVATSFILATTGAIVDVARRVLGDVLSLALHPVREYQNAKLVWNNGMDSEETSIS